MLSRRALEVATDTGGGQIGDGGFAGREFLYRSQSHDAGERVRTSTDAAVELRRTRRYCFPSL